MEEKKEKDLRKKHIGEKKYRDRKDRNLHRGESQRKNGLYRYTYVINGKPHEISSWKLEESDPLPKGARQCKALRTLEKEVECLIAKGVLPNAVSISKLCEIYLEYEKRVQKKSLKTIKGYQTSFNRIIEDDFGKLIVSKIDKRKAGEWFVGFQKREELGYSSIKNMKAFLKNAYKYAIEVEKLAVDNPFDFTDADCGLIDDSKPIMALSESNRDSYLNYIMNSDKYKKYYDIFYILFYTGLRVSELIALTIDDLDFDKKVINVNSQLNTSTSDYQLNCLKGTAKNSKYAKTRQVPMFKDVDKAFKRLIENEKKSDITIYPADKEKRIKAKNGFIFINNQGRVCSAKNIEDLFSRAVDSYNSEMNCNIILKPHICRHTFASILASNNCNRAYLQRLLGHNDYKTTDKFYIQFETNTFISDCLSECDSML